MNLITTQGLAMHDTKCCSGTCDQGRTCPAREAEGNVLQFQARNQLHRVTAPVREVAFDFAHFWRIPRINWGGVAFFAVLAVSGFATYKTVTGLAQIIARAW
jgi:hypothetical protein